MRDLRIPNRSGRRVLVTGDRGFVGSVLVGDLFDHRFDVKGIDALWFHPDSGRLWQDLSEAELTGCDAVVHLAGFSDDRLTDANPELARVTMVDDTVDFARRCRDAGVGRFVFASSAAVYGQTDGPAGESAACCPQSLYARSKLEAEQQILELANPDFDPVALRFGSGFGWSPAARFDLVVNKMTLIALREGHLASGSTGSSHRPFVHVRDMSAALIHALQIDAGDAKACFNVVHPDGNLTVSQVIDVIADHTGAIVGTPGDVVDQRDYQIDPSAFIDTGFTYGHSLTAGVRDLVSRLHYDPVGIRSPWDRQIIAPGYRPTTGTQPLVTPAVLDGDARRKFLDDVVDVIDRSRYRLAGGHRDTATDLVSTAFGLPDHHQALLLRSGTDALMLALKAVGVGAGTRVAMPDHAFHAVGATILNLGAVPVPVDVERHDFNLSVTALDDVFARGRIDAVVAVDNYGTPADWLGLGATCRANGVPFVVDACESLGASRGELHQVDHADLVVVSFSFTKPVHAAGMGGALLGPNSVLEGVAADPRHLVRQMLLPELNAAYLVQAWPMLAENVARLRSTYETYRRVLEPLGFTPQREDGSSTRLHAPFLVPIDTPWTRDSFLDALNDKGIAATPQFPTQSRLLGLVADCPVSHDIGARVVSLPSGAGLDQASVEDVAELTAAVYNTI